MDSIMVTGCAGFIGYTLSKELLDMGHMVVGVDSMTRNSELLKCGRLEDLRGYDGFSMTYADVNDDVVGSLFDRYRPTTVFHLAGEAGVRDSIDNPLLYVDSNIRGTVSILELCREYDVSDYIFASSASIDGEGGTPDSQYGVTKLCGEAFGRVYSKLYPMNVTSLKYYSIYGPWGRPDMAPLKFMHLIYNDMPLMVFGDGGQTRPFTYIDDLVRGNVMAMDNSGYSSYDVGSSTSHSVNYLISVIEDVIGHTANIHYAPRHPADTIVGARPTTTMDGWVDMVSLEEGIRRTFNWYLSRIDLMNEVFSGMES